MVRSGCISAVGPTISSIVGVSHNIGLVVDVSLARLRRGEERVDVEVSSMEVSETHQEEMQQHTSQT